MWYSRISVHNISFFKFIYITFLHLLRIFTFNCYEDGLCPLDMELLDCRVSGGCDGECAVAIVEQKINLVSSVGEFSSGGGGGQIYRGISLTLSPHIFNLFESITGMSLHDCFSFMMSSSRNSCDLRRRVRSSSFGIQIVYYS